MKSVRAAFLTLLASLAIPLSGAMAQVSGTVTVLHAFGLTDSTPSRGLIKATDGNLYGVATLAGAGNAGILYRLAGDGTGFTVVHDFNTADGKGPNQVIQAADGNLYGTTEQGGANNNGAFYRVALDGSGFTDLYDFNGIDNGAFLPNGLTQAADGNFYGTTTGGGSVTNGGTVFRLTPAGAFTVLKAFQPLEGVNPKDPLVIGPDGNLYGATPKGGNAALAGEQSNYGSFFRVTLAGEVTILHSLVDAEVNGDATALTLGADGAFYLPSAQGGAGGTNDGTIARIALDGTTTVLHQFAAAADDRFPMAKLTASTDTSLYGGTRGDSTAGTLFRVTLAGQFGTLYRIPTDFSQGGAPDGPMVQLSDTTFVGTTTGGTNTDGTVFLLTVSGLGGVVTPPPPPPTGVIPAITATATMSQASQGRPGVYVFARTGDDLSTDVEVAYVLKGSAKNGRDYRTLTGFVTIPAGSDSVKVKVRPRGTLAPGQKKTVALKLQPSDAYTVGTAGKVKIKIAGR